MNTNFLLSNKFKSVGWLILVLGLVTGLFVIFAGYESSVLEVKVLSIYSKPIIGDDNGFFKIIENSILDEIAALFIIIGGVLVGFSREKTEDEYIAKLRTDSLMWALFVNYTILVLAIIFVYDFTFFDVLVFNMFTPLLFFILRFNFLKIKA
ncbi:hypothetical protein [Yeosuana marina]|uniref:hypothetical protein n=1 Tax=Yeosuana marina TaxID=1565536 RepID=UPI001420E8E5|nr:hypothetical protein [Yeosuana marina]